MNKKGVWTAREYIIGLILFSAVIGLAYLMVGSQAIDYDNPSIVNEQFSEHYDKLTESTESVGNMLSSTSSSEGQGLLSVGEALLTGTFAVVSLIFQSLGVVGSQVIHIGTDFDVPPQIASIIVTVFLAIITVSIIFIILNAINKSHRL